MWFGKYHVLNCKSEQILFVYNELLDNESFDIEKKKIWKIPKEEKNPIIMSKTLTISLEKSENDENKIRHNIKSRV